MAKAICRQVLSELSGLSNTLRPDTTVVLELGEGISRVDFALLNAVKGLVGHNRAAGRAHLVFSHAAKGTPSGEFEAGGFKLQVSQLSSRGDGQAARGAGTSANARAGEDLDGLN